MMPALLWLLLGCQPKADCYDVGREIAVRTWECTGDAELGYARSERLQYGGGCGDTADAKVSQDCTHQIEALSCADVERLGDDPSAWIAEIPACDGIGATGSAPSETTDGGTLPCTVSGYETPTQVDVVNNHAEAVTLFYRDPSCFETQGSTIEAGGYLPAFNGFIGMVYVAREADGDLVDVYTIEAATATWTVP
jgi:hypothetical protein